MKYSLLVFYANPQDQKLLNLKSEKELILESVKNPKVNQIIPTFIENTRTPNIHKSLLEKEPDIVYFGCHGYENG